MRELDLDGIHDDGEHLLLVDSDGDRYTLRIDRALRAAVRSDRPALNMIQAADATPLRPKEIQAMLRAGRSAEEISETSEIPLEHVRRYEGPVLAEREWTAQRARTFPVGRGGPALQEVVAERLAAREATGESAWDAWRRPDGTWTLELTFSAGGRTRQAHWAADVETRSVSPLDDEARWISDEDAPPEPSRGRGRLQAVKSSVYDLEADGSLEGESPRARTWPPRRPVADEHPSALEDSELDALNARRGMRSVPRPDDSATVWSGLDETVEEPGDDGTEAQGSDLAADPDPRTDPARPVAPLLSGPAATGADAAADGSPADHDPDAEALREHSSAPEEQDGQGADEELAAEDPSDSPSAQDGAEDPAEGTADETDDEPQGPEIQYQDTVDLTPLPGFDDASAAARGEGSGESEEPAKPPRKSSRSKSKRASMPSWDEIVFGSRND
ncbi:septation protein SepH [Brachybacterium paraconglomeratum]|uniref:septation protein SepH n=1 Tax=Brachybacterium paraconglomeratum TaxID=173362 RepID=UPI0022E42000|nr:septation protein SepH [Brachybacterium paraconglomeratum]